MTRDSDVPPTDRGESSTAPTHDLEADRGDPLLRAIANMTPRTPARELEVGTLVDATYRIERRLGAGGMGVVYLARDTKLDRDVALKLHLGAADQRLAREAKAIASLVDPNVVTVHEIGVFEGHPFVAMEYLDGGTARTWVSDAERSTDEILAVYLAAARGLAAAHRAGLVHRDFKPDNVLVGRDGRIRVADFGLVGVEASGPVVAPLTSAMTITGAVLGTPAYMAPEQHAGTKIGPAADQFAFCVSLWEALFGERPFRGDTLAALAFAIASGPPSPRGTTRAVPSRVVRALERGLHVDPAERFASMTELIAALAPPRPRRLAPLVAVGAILVAGGTVAITMRNADPPETTAPRDGAMVAIVLDAAATIDAAIVPPDAAIVVAADAAVVDAAPRADAAPRPRPAPDVERTCTRNEDCKRSENCMGSICKLRFECDPAFVASTEHDADEYMKNIMYSHARELYTLVLRCKPSLVTKALRAACKNHDSVSATALWPQVPRARRAAAAKECLAEGIELR